MGMSMDDRGTGGAPLEFKPDLEEAQRHWLAFWEQEVVDRPCCCIRSPRDGVTVPPGPPYLAGAQGEFGPVIEQIVDHFGATYFAGDAVPAYTPSFGPDQMAAWVGADLDFSADGFGTSWVKPMVEDWEAALPLTLDTEGGWWTRMLAFMRELARALDGKMLISHLYLHSNMDLLSALRLPARLCLDMVDCPEVIDRAMEGARALYAPVYDALYEAGGMGAHGTTGWVTAYHPVRTNTIQCDFAALIGPAHFRRWVLPALEEEAAYLEHCVFHLDGPECLVHLDDLCSVRGLDCIQWVHGARNRPFIEWIDLLKEIQAKGTSVWVPCGVDDIRVFHRELEPSRVFYDCWAPTQQQADETLAWLVANT